MKRMLLTGSREFTDASMVRRAMVDYWLEVTPEAVTLIHGACPTGADALAASWWEGFGRMESHPADWDTHGKKAGPLRNQEMVDLGADVCLAFFRMGAANRGTSDCVERAKAAGIEVREFRGK